MFWNCERVRLQPTWDCNFLLLMKLSKNWSFAWIGDGRGWRFLEFSRFEKPDTTAKQGSNLSVVTSFLPFLHGKLTEVFMENWQDSAPPSSALDVGPQGPAPTHSVKEMQKGFSSVRKKPRALKTTPRSPVDLFYVTFQYCFFPRLLAFPQAPQSKTHPTGCLALHFPHSNGCFHELCLWGLLGWLSIPLDVMVGWLSPCASMDPSCWSGKGQRRMEAVFISRSKMSFPLENISRCRSLSRWNKIVPCKMSIPAIVPVGLACSKENKFHLQWLMPIAALHQLFPAHTQSLERLLWSKTFSLFWFQLLQTEGFQHFL